MKHIRQADYVHISSVTSPNFLDPIGRKSYLALLLHCQSAYLVERHERSSKCFDTLALCSSARGQVHL